MEKILKHQEHNTYIGCVISLVKESQMNYGGFYSVWVGTNCVDFVLSLDAANEMYVNFLNIK